MSQDVHYTADLTDVADELVDRLGFRPLADATLFIDQMAGMGYRPVRSVSTRTRDAIHAIMEQSYGWSHPRRLRAVLAMDALLDVEAAKPRADIVDDLDAALALLEPAGEPDKGYTCPFRVPMSKLTEMIEDGRATQVRKQ